MGSPIAAPDPSTHRRGLQRKTSGHPPIMGRPAALVKKGCGDRADEDRPLRTDDLGERAFQLAMALPPTPTRHLNHGPRTRRRITTEPDQPTHHTTPYADAPRNTRTARADNTSPEPAHTPNSPRPSERHWGQVTVDRLSATAAAKSSTVNTRRGRRSLRSGGVDLGTTSRPRRLRTSPRTPRSNWYRWSPARRRKRCSSSSGATRRVP